MQSFLNPNHIATIMSSTKDDATVRGIPGESSISPPSAEAAQNLLTLAKSNGRFTREDTGAVRGEAARGQGSESVADGSDDLEDEGSEQSEHHQNGKEGNEGEKGEKGRNRDKSQDHGVEEADTGDGTDETDELLDIGNGGEVDVNGDEVDDGGAGQEHDPMDIDEPSRVDERLANLEAKTSAMLKGFLACANGLASLGDDMKLLVTAGDLAPGMQLDPLVQQSKLTKTL